MQMPTSSLCTDLTCPALSEGNGTIPGCSKNALQLLMREANGLVPAHATEQPHRAPRDDATCRQEASPPATWS